MPSNPPAAAFFQGNLHVDFLLVSKPSCRAQSSCARPPALPRSNGKHLGGPVARDIAVVVLDEGLVRPVVHVAERLDGIEVLEGSQVSKGGTQSGWDRNYEAALARWLTCKICYRRSRDQPPRNLWSAGHRVERYVVALPCGLTVARAHRVQLDPRLSRKSGAGSNHPCARVQGPGQPRSSHPGTRCQLTAPSDPAS